MQFSLERETLMHMNRTGREMKGLLGGEKMGKSWHSSMKNFYKDTSQPTHSKSGIKFNKT